MIGADDVKVNANFGLKFSIESKGYFFIESAKAGEPGQEEKGVP